MDPALVTQLVFLGMRLVIDVVESVGGARENFDAFEALLKTLHAENREPTTEEIAPFLAAVASADDAVQAQVDRIHAAAQSGSDPNV